MRLPVFFVLAFSAAAGAQPLTTGTWTGTLTPARGSAVPVEAALEECVGGYKVDVRVAGREAGEAEGVRWADNRLLFRFVEPRSRRPHTCTLSRRPDGTLGGPCAIPRARPAALTLAPPATGAFGCTG